MLKLSICVLLFTWLASVCSSQQDVVPDTVAFNKAAEVLGYQEWAKGRAMMLEVAKKEPKNLLAWYNVAMASHKLQDFPTAIWAARYALTLDSMHAPSLFYLGVDLYLNNSADSAAPFLRQYAELQPDEAAMLNMDRLIFDMSQDSLGRTDSTFQDTYNSLQLILPASWAVSVLSDSVAWTVSLDPILGKGEVYLTGITVWPALRKKDARRGYNKVALSWKDVRKETFLVDDWKAEQREAIVQRTKEGHEYYLVHVRYIKGARAVDLRFETPVRYWTAYRERINRAVREIVLPRTGNVKN